MRFYSNRYEFTSSDLLLMPMKLEEVILGALVCWYLSAYGVSDILCILHICIVGLSKLTTELVKIYRFALYVYPPFVNSTLGTW